MARIIKGRQMAARYYKGREVLKEYKQGRLVYEKSTAIPDYLCFTALVSGTFTLTIPAAVTPTYLSYVEWSKNGRTWNHTDNTSEAVTIDVQVASGEKVYWRGSGVCMNDSTHANIAYCSVFTQTEDTPNFVASGNLVSLIALSDFDYVVRQACAFANLFNGNEKLTDAETLILPMFGAAATYLFYMTFKNCSNLAKAPILNLTRTTSNCCFEMFRGTALTTMPELPDIALSNYCYSGMFRETNIEKAVLPSSATTLVTSCYSNIFSGCTHLKYVKCLATDISATGCLTNWLQGVSGTGTFIQAEGVTWPRGASGIPTGWVDVEKRTMPSGYKQVEYLLNPNLGAFNLQHVFDSANEAIELQFVNTADKGPFLGTTNHGGYYGNISVGKSGTTNLSVRIGIGDTTVNTSVLSVSADTPYTFRYEGNANGFKIYTNGNLQKSYTSGWDVQHTITVMYVYSNTESTTAPSTYPTWFGKCPFIGLKVWDGNSDIIIDFVPCIRESDGLAGFYDFARTTFYYSLNGNDFTAGEEI